MTVRERGARQRLPADANGWHVVHVFDARGADRVADPELGHAEGNVGEEGSDCRIQEDAALYLQQVAPAATPLLGRVPTELQEDGHILVGAGVVAVRRHEDDEDDNKADVCKEGPHEDEEEGR